MLKKSEKQITEKDFLNLIKMKDYVELLYFYSITFFKYLLHLKNTNIKTAYVNKTKRIQTASNALQSHKFRSFRLLVGLFVNFILLR